MFFACLTCLVGKCHSVCLLDHAQSAVRYNMCLILVGAKYILYLLVILVSK